MIIAAHVNSPDSLLLSSLLATAENNPNDQFIFFAKEAPLNLPANAHLVKINFNTQDIFSKIYWYRFQLPALLKKNNAAAFISEAGMLSSKVTLPQYLYFSETDFAQYYRFFKKAFSRSLLEAKKIFVAEEFIGAALQEKFKEASGKIKTVFHGLPTGITAAPVAADLIKQKFTDGFDYLVCPVNVSSRSYIVILLKAFSQLKKWQKTSLKLVLLNELPTDDIVPGFKSYKYRDEVKIISVREKNAGSLLPHAFGLVWLNHFSFSNMAFKAMLHGIPVIAENSKTNRLLFDAAAMLSEVTETALAEKMQLLYKDEALKNGLGEKSKTLMQRYDTAESARLLWNEIK